MKNKNEFFNGLNSEIIKNKQWNKDNIIQLSFTFVLLIHNKKMNNIIFYNNEELITDIENKIVSLNLETQSFFMKNVYRYYNNLDYFKNILFNVNKKKLKKLVNARYIYNTVDTEILDYLAINLYSENFYQSYINKKNKNPYFLEKIEEIKLKEKLLTEINTAHLKEKIKRKI